MRLVVVALALALVAGWGDPVRPQVAVSAPAELVAPLEEFSLGHLVEVREYTSLAGGGTYASTLYQYDGHDLVSRIQNPDGVVTQLMHDLGGRRTTIVRGGRTWTYDYNVEDQLTSESVPGPARPVR